MSFNPIGWAMIGNGLSDDVKSMRGVSTEVDETSTETLADVTDSAKSDTVNALEELNKMKNRGLISVSDYEEKKAELLERI